MNRNEESEEIDNLFRNILNLVDITLNSGENRLVGKKETNDMWDIFQCSKMKKNSFLKYVERSWEEIHLRRKETFAN